jgi:S-DNA-T family DNA segregation ATPase FtsK/SpoIIIE
MNKYFEKLKNKSDITALIWLAIGIFFTLALLSFDPRDPSLSTLGFGLKVRNWCGYLGALFADLSFQAIGLGSWMFIISIFTASFVSIRGEAFEWKRQNIILLGVITLSISTILSTHFKGYKIFSDTILVGGWIGDKVATGLLAILNPIGTIIVLWAMFFVALMIFTNTRIDSVWGVIKKIPLKKAVLALFNALKNSLMIKAVNKKQNIDRYVSAQPRSFLESIEKAPTQLNTSEIIDNVSGPQSDESIEEVPEIKRLKLEPRKKVKQIARSENWNLPQLSILEDPPAKKEKVDERELKDKAALLTNKFEQFSVNGKIVGIKPGPAVTMFEFKPNVDVKISKITELADDLSLALSSESVRIIAPIPGRDVVGIESSNSIRETVFLKEVLAEPDFWKEDFALPIALGKQADGRPRVVDLRKMPHLLVAGSTGSGKSVFTVSIILGLLFRHSPDTLRMILIDPKQVDLTAFNDIPHLLTEPVRDPKKAVYTLKWAIREMDKRYRSMAKFSARGLEAYNETVSKLSKDEIEHHKNENEKNPDSGQISSYYYEKLPYILIAIEEFGDLMAVDKANVEHSVVRLAQMARACGIHLILAMQSPRKDVVTGLIKTNIPGRISFKVASKMDSRIILDESGAERLLTRGDMLFLAPGVPKPARFHGPWVTDREIAEVMEFWKSQGEPEYHEGLSLNPLEHSGGESDGIGAQFDSMDTENEDEMFGQILNFVNNQKEVSASLLQRRFRLGYPRAARIVEILEAKGIVGPAQGSKPRRVLSSSQSSQL